MRRKEITAKLLTAAMAATMIFGVCQVSALAEEATEVALDSTTIGGVTYYYTDNIDENNDYTIVTRSRQDTTTTHYTLSQLTAAGETGIYYIVTSGTPVESLEGTLYGYSTDGAKTYSEVYKALGLEVNADDYDAITSATNFTSFHAKDISGIANVDKSGETPVLTGIKAQASLNCSAQDYVNAALMQADGKDLTADQQDLLKVTLKSDASVAFKTGVKPVAASATLASSSYGKEEIQIVPDDTVEGYVWNEYWNNIYAITLSDETNTTGAVEWIDAYGENSTSGYHYNKIELAINNGTSKGANAATVNRFAQFVDAAGHLKAGEYTVTVYAEGYEAMTATVTAPERQEVTLNSTTIGGVTYYYTDQYGADDEYVVATSSRQGTTYTYYDASDLTQVADTDVYYMAAAGSTPIESLEGTLYGYTTEGAKTYSEVYKELGLEVKADDYDVITSATNYTSFHSKDIATIANVDKTGETPAITGVKVQTTFDGSAQDYVNAAILQAAGRDLTADQQDLLKVALKSDANVPFASGVKPVAASASLTDSRYGTNEFVIVPDDTVEGYVWNDYWNNIYAITISDGTSTAGAVHWIDAYGENSTSGYHYNKLEIALNNGTSVGANAAEVNRFADFYDSANVLKAGTYTIKVYAEGYDTMTAEIAVTDERNDVTATLANKTVTYNGKVQAIGAAKATVSGETVADPEVTYTYYSDKAMTKAVKASAVKNAGTYYVKAVIAPTVYNKGAEATAKLVIKKASNSITKVTSAKTVSYKKVVKKAQTFNLAATVKVSAKKTFKKVSGSSKITVSSAGKVTVKKGLKKGTYKIKVKVTAAATTNYNAASKYAYVKIKVK